ncbi:hypothetical protein BUH_4317 [Burkholderia pseudomallei Pakistan 9]|nr:hypothetical protein BUH_4317 [Burkholderia pseudomallei Pakistan 9]
MTIFCTRFTSLFQTASGTCSTIHSDRHVPQRHVFMMSTSPRFEVPRRNPWRSDSNRIATVH